MGGSSTPATTKSTTTQELPRWVTPYSLQLLGRGVKESKRPFVPYGRARVATGSPDITRGLSYIRSTAAGQGAPADVGRGLSYIRSTAAGQGAPADVGRGLDYIRRTALGQSGQTQDQLAALEAIRQTVGGRYLDPASNPWLGKTYAIGARDIGEAHRTGIAAQTDASAATGRAFGGSAHAELMSQQGRDLGRTLSDYHTQLYGGQYAQERANQLAATQALYGTGETERDRRLGASEALYQAGLGERQARLGSSEALYRAGQEAMDRRLGASEALYRAGETQRGIGQQELDAQYAEWLRGQEWPLRQLDILGSTIGQSMGRAGSATTTQQQPSLSFNPYAAAGGAGLGLLGAYGGSQGWYN